MSRPGFDLAREQAGGMVAVHLAWGPWGVVQASWPEAARAAIRATSLDEVTVALAGYDAAV